MKIEEIKNMLGEIRPYPWMCDDNEGFSIWAIYSGKSLIANIVGDSAQTDATANFIAASPEIISQLLKQNEELIKALFLIATAPYTQLPLPPELNMSKAIEVLMGIAQLALKKCDEMENQ